MSSDFTPVYATRDSSIDGAGRTDLPVNRAVPVPEAGLLLLLLQLLLHLHDGLAQHRLVRV